MCLCATTTKMSNMKGICVKTIFCVITGGGWKQSSEAFMFSLRNKENLPPFKAPLKRRKQQYAIYSSSNYGPIFGGGHDLLIFNKAASNTGSFTNFGRTYQPPRNVRNPRTILAGSYRFTPSEVEVFHLV